MLEDDEQRLWNRSLEEQELLNASSHVVHDSATVVYLNAIAARLMPETLQELPLTMKVHLIRHPMLNAFAYPNGAIYLHTGLLVRIENEAQLAALIGHEMAHVLHRHGLRSIRDIKNKSGFLAVFQIATLPFGLIGGLASVIGALGTRTAVSGYSRVLETEADSLGMVMMVEAGYDPAEAVRLFEHMLQDLEEQGHHEPFFFGTHPRVKERLQNSRRFAALYYAEQTGDVGTAALQPYREEYWFDTIELDLAAGRYSSARRLAVTYLARYPNAAPVHYYVGEALRLQPQPELDAAQAAYERALTNDPSYAPAHQALGLHHYRAGRFAEAVPYLKRYLMLEPEASERAYIQQYLNEAQRTQP